MRDIDKQRLERRINHLKRMIERVRKALAQSEPDSYAYAFSSGVLGRLNQELEWLKFFSLAD